MTSATIVPFTLDVPHAQIEDLRRRLGATRWPAPLDETGWDDGTEFVFLQRLAEHWQHRFSWPEQQARLNRLPHFMARIDGYDIHFVHQRGHGPAPMPLVLTHGWPGAFTEFERILPLLTDPARHGGSAGDAFDVVVPSLPGFGFSPAPRSPGTSSRRVAQLWRALMHALGYRRFGAQGGDIGAGVSTWLARLYPDDVLGLHLNYIPGSYRPPLDATAPPLSPEERGFLDEAAGFAAAEGAYAALQATKPQTLAFALTDSPVGLAAWIAEKFRAWSDCDGELEQVVPLDTLLTDISLYWFGNSLDASLRIYKENRLAPLQFAAGERVAPPLGFARFPRELPTPPRRYVERVFRVERWREMPAGGHFAALERPAELAEEIRAFFRPLRGA
ncbi:MAG: epoxide hydrolase [Pseudomonas sp.]